MLLPENWPLYNKIVTDWRGGVYLVERGIGEMQLIQYLDDLYGRQMPYIVSVVPVSQEYYDQYHEQWFGNSRLITAETLGVEGEANQEGGEW